MEPDQLTRNGTKQYVTYSTFGFSIGATDAYTLFLLIIIPVNHPSFPKVWRFFFFIHSLALGLSTTEFPLAIQGQIIDFCLPIHATP